MLKCFVPNNVKFDSGCCHMDAPCPYFVTARKIFLMNIFDFVTGPLTVSTLVGPHVLSGSYVV